MLPSNMLSTNSTQSAMFYMFCTYVFILRFLNCAISAWYFLLVNIIHCEVYLIWFWFCDWYGWWCDYNLFFHYACKINMILRVIDWCLLLEYVRRISSILCNSMKTNNQMHSELFLWSVKYISFIWFLLLKMRKPNVIRIPFVSICNNCYAFIRSCD